MQNTRLVFSRASHQPVLDVLACCFFATYLHAHAHTHTHTTHTHTHTHTYTHTHTHVALWLGSQRQLLSAPTSLLPISSLILPGPSRALGIHTLGRPHLLSCGADPGGRESLLPPLSSLPAAAATT